MDAFGELPEAVVGQPSNLSCRFLPHNWPQNSLKLTDALQNYSSSRSQQSKQRKLSASLGFGRRRRRRLPRHSRLF